jgi:hypothetical protein
MSDRSRRWSLLAAAVVFAGCGAKQTSHVSPGGPASSSGIARVLRSDGWRTDFSRFSVPLTQFISGGPPRDGIPPIDHPRPVGLAGGDRFLRGREPVIAVVVNGQARAYPEQILVWHEIVNDRLGGVPIAVTYCPLCNSALVFDRRVGGRVLTFGTTGRLRNSDLVMWDRQTQSWWQQITGQAVVGSYTGTTLRPLDAQVLSWSDFKARYPGAAVLSRDTGFQRDYGVNPYVRYDQPSDRPFLYDGELDPRLPPKERVVALFAGRPVVVVPFSRLRRTPVVTAHAGAQPFVVLFKRGIASALDASRIADSRDVGTVGVFDPRLGKRTLTFRAAGDGAFSDAQTGSRWDITGRAIAGPLYGRRLRPLRHDEQFWFALAAFLPHARLL